MAITYDPTCSAERDQVRLLTGDTDTTVSNDEALQDLEIDFLLSQYGSVESAAAQAARALAAKFSRFCDLKIGAYSESLSQRAEGLLALAEKLEAQASLAGGWAIAGGISKADVEAVEADTDRVDPAFKIGMMDNERATVTGRDWRLGE